MAGLRTEYSVVMEDPEERSFVVEVDQRDYAALEALDDVAENAWHTRARYLVWNAMRRKKLTTADFPTFNRELCVSVTNVEESPDDEEDKQGLDPGRQPASAGS